MNAVKSTKTMCSVSRSSHFPVRVICDAMHEWMDSTIPHDDDNNNNNNNKNIASFGLGISQKREEPPINQNRKKVKRRRFFVHPIIRNRTTHTIIPGSIVYRKPNPSQFLLLFPEKGRERIIMIHCPDPFRPTHLETTDSSSTLSARSFNGAA